MVMPSGSFTHLKIFLNLKGIRQYPSSNCKGCCSQVSLISRLSYLRLITNTSSNTLIHIIYNNVGVGRRIRQGGVIQIITIKPFKYLYMAWKNTIQWDVSQRDVQVGFGGITVICAETTAIRATIGTVSKTLRSRSERRKTKQIEQNSYTASLSSFNSLAFGQRPKAHSYSPCITKLPQNVGCSQKLHLSPHKIKEEEYPLHSVFVLQYF